MIEAHQLRVFAAVADNLSFTKAAERLFLTQSAVSHQIARLERALGTALLERHGRSDFGFALSRSPLLIVASA